MKLLLTCFAVWLLSACASTVINTKINPDQPLPQSHGVVAVEVINDTDMLAPMHQRWTEVILLRLDNREEKKQQAIEAGRQKGIPADKVKWNLDVYSLHPSEQGLVHNQVFVGSMPQGTYLISRLWSFYSNGNMTSTVSMPVFEMAGRFTVESGRLTDLGSLVFQPLLNIRKPSFWSYSNSTKAYVTRLPSQPRLAPFVQASHKNLSADFNLTGPLGWMPDSIEPLRAELAKLSMDNATISKSVPLAVMGKGLALARMGSVKWIDEEDRWQHVQLPTYAAPLSALETQATVWIGAEQGTLFGLTRADAKPRLLNPVATTEAIIWMDRGATEFYALTQSVDKYTAYSFVAADQIWTKVGEFKRVPDNVFWTTGGIHALVNKKGELLVLNNGSVYRYLGQPLSWSAPTKNKSLRELRRLPGGALVGLETSQWNSGAGDQVVSVDDGNTWTSIKRNMTYIYGDDKGLPFVAGNRVYTPGRIRDEGRSSQVPVRLLFSDEKITKSTMAWHSAGVMPKECLRLLPDISREDRIYTLCDEGNVFFTSDKGKTWLPQISIDVAAMTGEFEKLLAQQAADKAMTSP